MRVADRRAKTQALPRSLAILPFRSLVPHEDERLLELGLADMLAMKLGHVQKLIVRPMSSLRRYDAPDRDPLIAGRELNVESVVDGTIHRSEGRLRATVRLLRVADGSSIWAGHFDERFDDVLKVEEAIAGRIAQGLKVRLAPEASLRPETGSFEAHRLYLVGRMHWNRMTPSDWKTSVSFFERALQLDRNYGVAYAGLATAWVSLAADELPAAEANSKAREAAEAALGIDETLADAHVALGRVKAYYDWDWSGAARAFDRAVYLSPNSADAHRERGLYYATVGRYAEAVDETRLAYQLDPLSPMTSFAAGWALIAARRYDDALKHLEKFHDIDPQSSAALTLTGMAYLGQKKYDGAVISLRRALSQFPQNLGQKAQLGFAYAKLGRRAEAKEMLGELRALSNERNVTPYYLAVVYAGLGDRGAVFAALEQAYRERSRRLWALNVVPMWEDLRSDPRFRDLLRRMGLPQG